jgi:hypothetical protein
MSLNWVEVIKSLGTVVTIVVASWTLWLKLREKPRRTASTPTPLDIDKAIAKATPYDKLHVEAKYTGYDVDWPVRYQSLLTSENQFVTVLFYFGRLVTGPIWLKVAVDLEHNIRLKTLPEGHSCWVRGKIKKTERRNIELEDGAQLTFD